MQEQIPTINLADFLTGGVTAIDQQALAVACEDHGFSSWRGMATTRW